MKKLNENFRVKIVMSTFLATILLLSVFVPLATIGHAHYRNHAVAAYAYTRLRRVGDGAIKTYVKISDGHRSSGRYIDLATINTNNTGMMLSWTSRHPTLRSWFR